MLDRKIIKLFALAAIISVLFSLVGCKNTQETTVSDKDVVLRWIIGGVGKQADSDIVWEEFNKKLKEVMPTTQIKIESIANADYAEKWKLIAASGEEVDIAWHGWMIPFDEEVRKGSYLPLDELLEKNAPELRTIMPEWVWENVRVDGKIYAIPNFQMMVQQATALRTPKELADKYLDYDRAVKAFSDWQDGDSLIVTDECFDVLEDYLAKLKADGKLGLGFSPELASWMFYKNNRNMATLIANVYVEYKDGKYTAKDSLAIEDQTFIRRATDFFKKGYIRQDALTITDLQKDNGMEGGYALWAHYYDKYSEESESTRYGMPITLIPIRNKPTQPIKAGTTNTVLSRTSKNPARAMEFLNVINAEKHKDLYNLLVYGIEGVHYKKETDERIETLDYVRQATATSRYGIAKWMLGNTFNAYETQSEPSGYLEYVEKELNSSGEPHPLEGFKFNTEKIKIELAQYENISKEFKGLHYGAYPNYEEMIRRRNEKYKKAGSDKIVEDVQRQLDEWVKTKN